MSFSGKKRKTDDLAGPGIGDYNDLGLVKNYKAILTARETMQACNLIQTTLQTELCRRLNLEPVQVPLVVREDSGVNDSLDRDGSRKPVSFTMKNDGEHVVEASVVQAATKWKRLALAQFGFACNEGIITYMKAVRSGYFLDQDHSCTVTQFDWEQAIRSEDRTLKRLKQTVNEIWSALQAAEKALHEKFPERLGSPTLPEGPLRFVWADQLKAKYPSMDRKERETQALKDYGGALFLLGIGYPMDGGDPHELRAVDYDDWISEVQDDDDNGRKHRGLNGDILVMNPTTGRRHELSSMGIRVDAAQLQEQLELCNQTELAQLPYHKKILNGSVPSAIGGGLGIERIFMLFTKKACIGEVSVTPWPDVFIQKCEQANIKLLE